MCRGTTHGGTAINVNVYRPGVYRHPDNYHVVFEFDTDNDRPRDADGTEYVLVRRDDYDNLVAACDNDDNATRDDLYDAAIDLYDAARTLVDNTNR
jgi:hypothetical protein